MANGALDAMNAFDQALSAVSEGHPTIARDELTGVSTEELVRLHRKVRVVCGIIESLLIERVGAASAVMLLAAKG